MVPCLSLHESLHGGSFLGDLAEALTFSSLKHTHPKDLKEIVHCRQEETDPDLEVRVESLEAFILFEWRGIKLELKCV